MIIKKLNNWADTKTQEEFNNLIAISGGVIFIGMGVLSMIIDNL